MTIVFYAGVQVRSFLTPRQLSDCTISMPNPRAAIVLAAGGVRYLQIMRLGLRIARCPILYRSGHPATRPAQKRSSRHGEPFMLRGFRQTSDLKPSRAVKELNFRDLF